MSAAEMIFVVYVVGFVLRAAMPFVALVGLAIRGLDWNVAYPEVMARASIWPLGVVWWLVGGWWQ